MNSEAFYVVKLCPFRLRVAGGESWSHVLAKGTKEEGRERVETGQDSLHIIVLFCSCRLVTLLFVESSISRSGV